jgi:hypothetical protein
MDPEIKSQCRQALVRANMALHTEDPEGLRLHIKLAQELSTKLQSSGPEQAPLFEVASDD